MNHDLDKMSLPKSSRNQELEIFLWHKKEISLTLFIMILIKVKRLFFLYINLIKLILLSNLIAGIASVNTKLPSSFLPNITAGEPSHFTVKFFTSFHKLAIIVSARIAPFDPSQ